MKNVSEYLKSLIKDDTIVIGVSGGPDSMVLLYLLMQTGAKIICAHVNHNVRKESVKEYAYVENFCKTNNLIFEGMKIGGYSKKNFEEEAREKRYEFFDKLMSKHQAKYLFTAHHGDDLMETILMRLVRGSTLKGYAGFEKIRDVNNYKLVRPLITVTKDDILEFCNKNNIKYAVDKTNFEDIHTRNRYRKYLLPKLKEENKNVNSKFLEFSETLLEVNNYLEAETKKNNVIKNDKLDIEKFLKLNILIQKRIVYNFLEKFISANDIKEANIIDIIKLANNQNNAIIFLPNNIIATKSYNWLELSLNHIPEDYEFVLEQSIKFPNGKELVFLKESSQTNNFICYLDSKEIKLPLIVRNRRIGDKMEILGLNGTKSVSDILTNSKIKKQDRNTIPIVLDSDSKIVWIPGIKKSKFDKTKTKKYDIILEYRY